MNRHNSIPSPGGHESSVALRYSLASSDMFRTDVILEDGGHPRRILSYPVPPQEVLAIRQAMIDRGFVLGKRIESQGGAEEKFEIPTSARPIIHDAAITGSSRSHEYGDTELFYDLGTMMGILASQGTESPVILNDMIGKNIATREFTREGERRVLLVPGFELALNPVHDDDEALSVYIARLHQEFAPRFEPNVGNFVEGFMTAWEAE